MNRMWTVMATVAMVATTNAFAQTPVDGALTYQGRLKDQGQPASGPYDMQFRLYAADTGGTPLATYPSGGPMAVTVQDGLFTALIDFGIEAFNGERRWLEVVVEGTTLAPRQELTVTPYALYALNGPGGESFWQAGTGGAIYYSGGNVGIGADPTPNHLLEVAGDDVLISTIGGGQANLILNDTDGGATPPGIVFWNNAESAFYADDLTEEIFAFWAGYPSPRVHAAHLRVYGHEDTQFIDLTHDGDDAIVSSASGDLVLNSTGTSSAGLVLNGGTNGDMAFYTGTFVPASERMRITAGGDVGIGISTPGARLNAYTPGATALMGQSGSGLGVYGISSSNAGVMGYNNTSGALGKLGDSTYAVYGEKPDGYAGYFAGDVHITGDLTLDGVFDANAWSRTGNAGTDPNVNFLGTTDNQPLVLKANGLQIMRLEPTAFSPNVIAGFVDNQVLSGVVGATIGGGGRPDDGIGEPEYNWVRAHYGTIAGGAANRVGGSGGPEDGQYSTVGGGDFNNASGEYNAIGGGHSNWTGGGYASIPGGINNQAAGDYSLAAGRRAIVRSPAQVGGGDTDGDEGTFVWADSTDADFTSTGPNQFLVRATGGVNFVADADPNTGGGLRIQPVAAPDQYANRTPNLVNGYTGNNVTSGVVGATIAGGGAAIIAAAPSQNAVTDNYGTVGGGARNVAGNDTGTTTDARYATVGGGLNNSASGAHSTVGGGGFNYATGHYSTVGGGGGNDPAGDYSTVGGGGGNDPTGYASTVGGGYDNDPTGNYSTVGGGDDNDPTGDRSTVGGGQGNDPAGDYSTVGGGGENDPTGYASTVGGGYDNDPTGNYSTVGGGRYNDADGDDSTVDGGAVNEAIGDGSSVGGGHLNSATGTDSTVGGGNTNAASGTESTVPGGSFNQAGGQFSFAAGRRAKVRNAAQAGDADGDEGTFIWADSTDADFLSTGPDQFLIRAAGGVGINTNSPSNDLSVTGDADFAGNVGIGNSDPGYPLHFASATGEKICFYGAAGSTNTGIGISTTALGIHTNGSGADIIFGHGSMASFTETVRFKGTGNVGIGLQNPADKLGVFGTVGIDSNASNGAVLRFRDNGSLKWTFIYRPWASDEFGLFNEQLGGFAMTFRTGTNNVGIGVTDPSEKLDTNGTARLRGLGTSTGTTVVADANGKLWKQSSSLRYKHNIADLPTAGDAVLDLRAVSFDWNSTGAPDIGLIAEEVDCVLPDLVIRDADGRPDGVRYDKVSLYLLSVVKDQRDQLASQGGQLAKQEDHIAAQQAQIEAQHDELTSLRARLEKIEALLAEHAAQPTGGAR